ncbi:MAG TPA: aldo/keto reductase [Thermomicrobiales bacterium]|nr:aldo/keto reductase [Thermomicrobiales bacterium]
MNPLERVPLGDTGLRVTRLGYGSAAIDRRWIDEATAHSTIRAAFDAGLRHIDTAPMYDFGWSELMVGAALAELPRDEIVLSTKVGRIVPGYEPGGGAGTEWQFDFTADGTKRSIEHSLARLGVDRIDIVLIHDADNHFEEAVGGAYTVLEDLRRQGMVKAIGIGMTNIPWPTRWIQETDIDVLLLAGRYSLLDPEAGGTLYPLCQERGISVWNAGSLHGGLIDGVARREFHYQPVDPATQARLDTIRGICERNGVPTAAAAIQFPLAHPAVTSVLTGPYTPEQLEQNLSWARVEVPQDVWDELRAAGILTADIPTPSNNEGTSA